MKGVLGMYYLIFSALCCFS